MENLDEVGIWSEIKLHIVREYAKAYSTIIAAQPWSLYHVYIDAFAGSGGHRAKGTKEFIPGSPLNALWVEPPFKEYYFIDIKKKKVRDLEEIAGKRKDIHIFHEDCNRVLLEEIFPRVQFKDMRRGLCLLDPYSIDLDWQVIQEAGRMRSIEIFLNFQISDMNRNVLWTEPEKVNPRQLARMDRFWGDDSWRKAAYKQDITLFGMKDKKTDNESVVRAFRERLQKVAGFNYVPEPIPMRNSKNAVVYYLFFASQKPVAAYIVTDIFKKYSG